MRDPVSKSSMDAPEEGHDSRLMSGFTSSRIRSISTPPPNASQKLWETSTGRSPKVSQLLTKTAKQQERVSVHGNLDFIDSDSSVRILRNASRGTLKWEHFITHKSHTNRSDFKNPKGDWILTKSNAWLKHLGTRGGLGA